MALFNTSTKENKDIFVKPRINKGDKWYAFVQFILTLIFIFSLIASSSTKAYGDIYTPIELLSLTLIILSIITKGKFLFNEVLFGNIESRGDLFKTICVGLIFGLVAFFVVEIFSGGLLSFSSSILPLAIGAGATVTLSEFFVVGFIGVEAEDSLVQSLIIPTIAAALNNPFVLSIVFFIATLIFLTAIPGTLIIGVAFFFIGLLFLSFKVLRIDLTKSDRAKHLIAALIGAIGIGGIYHYYSYSLTSSNPYGSIIVAGLFFFVFALENWQQQNTIAGRMSHSVFNLMLLTTILAAPFTYMILVVFIYVAIIIATYEASRWRKA
jgi:hypothetical protein